MSRRKKTEETPEIMDATVEKVAEPASPVIESAPVEDVKPVIVATQETPYSPAIEVRELIRETMINAPKRNDGTTMPTPVSLRCSAGDMFFIMYQFDATVVENLWLKVKGKVTPEEFVNYLYTTMGLTPPKLYIYRKDIAIA